MKRFFACLVFGIALLGMSGCSVLAPDISKAQTEERQLRVAEEELDLAKRELAVNERIADALERIADSLDEQSR